MAETTGFTTDTQQSADPRPSRMSPAVISFILPSQSLLSVSLSLIFVL